MPFRTIDGAGILAERRTVETKELLRKTAALHTNSHFVLNSGKHSADYVNKDAVFTSPRALEKLGADMASFFNRAEVDVVLGPTMGGAILASRVAYAMSSPAPGGKEIFCAFADKVGDDFVLKRGYDKAIHGKRVVICEDVTSTGRSARNVAKLVKASCGIVVGAVAIWNRGNVTAADLDVAVFNAIISEPIQAWEESECPMCKEGVEIRTDLGHGAAYLAAKNK